MKNTMIFTLNIMIRTIFILFFILWFIQTGYFPGIEVIGYWFFGLLEQIFSSELNFSIIFNFDNNILEMPQILLGVSYISLKKIKELFDKGFSFTLIATAVNLDKDLVQNIVEDLQKVKNDPEQYELLQIELQKLALEEQEQELK